MSSLLDTTLLRTFVAVVEAGGFTRAAERVHLTQSTVSQQMKKLEADVGRVLLTRDRADTQTKATEAGEILLGYAKRILAICSEAHEVMRQPSSIRTVRIGVTEDFCGRRLINLLSRFSRAMPQIRLDTVSGWSLELRRHLDNGDIDLALVKREPDSGSALASWTENLVWVTGLDVEAPKEQVPLAVFPPGCIYRARAIQALESGGRPWRIAYTSQGLLGVQAAVASGLGVSLLSEDAVLAEHRSLSADDGFTAQPPSELALIAASSRLSRGTREVADFLVTNMADLQKPAAPEAGRITH